MHIIIMKLNTYMVHYAMSYPGVAVEVILIVIDATITNYCATVISPVSIYVYVVLLVFTLLYIAILRAHVHIGFKFKARRHCLSIILTMAVIIGYFSVGVVFMQFVLFSYILSIDFVDDTSLTWETVTMCNSYLTMSYVSQSVLVSMFICSGSLHAFSLSHFIKDYCTKNQVI